MEHVSVLFTDETVYLDQKKIDDLETLLGSKDSENVIGKAMEEVAIRLTQSERHFQAENWQDLRKTVKSIGAISDQIGMQSLTSVSHMVLDAIDRCNAPAVAATFFRLLRIGDRSLSDFWDLQDVSG